jgi:uncharacterized membrane protein
MNCQKVFAVLMLATLGVTVSAQAVSAESPFKVGAAEARANGGVVVIPGSPEFFAKSPAEKVKTLSVIWKMLLANGAPVRRLDVVRSTDAVARGAQRTVVLNYSPTSGLTNAP